MRAEQFGHAGTCRHVVRPDPLEQIIRNFASGRKGPALLGSPLDPPPKVRLCVEQRNPGAPILVAFKGEGEVLEFGDDQALAPATVSRGFRAAFGTAPVRYRAMIKRFRIPTPTNAYWPRCGDGSSFLTPQT